MSEQQINDAPTNEIELGNHTLYLAMPRGKAGRKGVMMCQKAFESIMDDVGVDSVQEISGANAIRAARNLFEYPGFEDKIMPFILQNTAPPMTHEEAKAFMEDLGDSIVNILNQFMAAMLFFLAGSDQPALGEAMGKSNAASQG